MSEFIWSMFACLSRLYDYAATGSSWQSHCCGCRWFIELVWYLSLRAGDIQACYWRDSCAINGFRSDSVARL